jgi:hypothetical protein
VYVYTLKLNDECGAASFMATFSGVFDRTNISYEAVAHFAGEPYGPYTSGVLQGGVLNNVTLILKNGVSG